MPRLFKATVLGSGFKGSGWIEVSGVRFQVSGRMEESGFGGESSDSEELY
jgi:hypothetical protein